VVKKDRPLRMDETHKRLLDWTYGQPPSERLAALILDDEGYRDIDPSHPLGGTDGGRDGHCTRDGEQGVWAVYFPRGQQRPKEISDKLEADIEAARKHDPEFLVFVTNQELKQSARTALRALGGNIRIELLHLERLGTNLDRQRMAAVREQFLRIPATPVSDESPLEVEVSVVGTAHKFTGDREVFDRWVEIREDRIREESDKGHARLRAEQEKKDREEADRRTREALKAVENEVKERRGAVAGDRPWEAPFAMPSLGDWVRDSSIFDSIAEQHRMPAFVSRMQGMPGAGGPPPKPPEPLSDEQINAKVAAYQASLGERWPACRDYLAGVAWDAVRFRIKNNTKAFLNDVEVVLTFRGARGVDFEDLADFELMKVEDPAWKASAASPYATGIPAMPLFRPKDYPIEWRHNDDGDLEVIVTLKRLRPRSEWRSDDYGGDIVMVVDPDSDLDAITVAYTATAHDYDDVFEGRPLTVPVESHAMKATLLEVMEANKDDTAN